MKKIQLSKETLRVLTANEAELVAGGVSNTCIPKQGPCGTESVPVNACATNNCPPQTDGCVTVTCPPATNGCTVGCATAGCPPTETQRRPRCVIP
jgi:hypothetical protein